MNDREAVEEKVKNCVKGYGEKILDKKL